MINFNNPLNKSQKEHPDQRLEEQSGIVLSLSESSSEDSPDPARSLRTMSRTSSTMFNPNKLNHHLGMACHKNQGLTSEKRWIEDTASNRAKMIDFIIKRAIIPTLFYHRKTMYYDCCNCFVRGKTHQSGHSRAYPSLLLLLEKHEIQKIKKFREAKRKQIACKNESKFRKLVKPAAIEFIKKLELNKIDDFIKYVVPRHDGCIQFTLSKKAFSYRCKSEAYLKGLEERAMAEEGDEEEQDSDDSDRSRFSVDLVAEVRRNAETRQKRLKKSSESANTPLMIEGTARPNSQEESSKSLFFGNVSEQENHSWMISSKQLNFDSQNSFGPTHPPSHDKDESLDLEVNWSQLCCEMDRLTLEKQTPPTQAGMDLILTSEISAQTEKPSGDTNEQDLLTNRVRDVLLSSQDQEILDLLQQKAVVESRIFGYQQDLSEIEQKIESLRVSQKALKD